MLWHHIDALIGGVCRGCGLETTALWGLSLRFELVFALQWSGWIFEKCVCSIEFGIVSYIRQLLRLFQVYLAVLLCGTLFQVSCYSRGCHYCSSQECAHFLSEARHVWFLLCPSLGSLFFRSAMLPSQCYWYMRNYLAEIYIVQSNHSML